MKIFIQHVFEEEKTFDDIVFSKMSYLPYLSKKKKLVDILKFGLSGSSLYAKLNNPYYINRLYIEKDKSYWRFLNDFKDRYKDYDIIVMNPGVDLVHPEFLYKNFPNTLKCLHFIDDPHQTYNYGLPFSWVFDCATYISPSYSADFTMSEILKHAGFKKTKWVPHCASNSIEPPYLEEELKNQLKTRNGKVIYVGGFYLSKNKRLTNLKRALGKNFDIYGRYPLKGNMLTLLSFLDGKPLLYRVRSISAQQKELFYSQYSIGLNMHLSTPSVEVGNARLYELAYRGVAQVVDYSSISLLKNIFEPEKEVLVYTNMKDCLDQLHRLKNNDDLRMEIALNAYKKAIEHYNYKKVMLELAGWFKKML